MGLASLARETAVKRPMTPAAVPPGAAVPPANSGSAQRNGFEMLTRYVPTETITLYVAAMTAHAEIASATGLSVWGIYWIAAVATPLFLALLTLRANLALDAAARRAPHWWPLTASFAAFLVWGLSIPPNHYATDLKVLPALAALMLSTFFSLLDPLLGPKNS